MNLKGSGSGARGFTLIESMVALAILALTLTVGVPAFAAVLQNVRETNTYHLLTSSLATARIASIRRNEFVTVCPSSTGSTCRKDSIWDEGWIVFLDPDRSGQPASSDAVLLRIDGIGAGLALHGTPGRRRVRFTPNGWSHSSNQKIRLCTTDDGLLQGLVAINVAGRARSERSTAPEPCPYRP